MIVGFRAGMPVESAAAASRSIIVRVGESVTRDAPTAMLHSSGHPERYVNALGPARRREWLLEQAIALGLPAQDPVALSRRGPIRARPGQKTAVGIAVAIAAGILMYINRRPAGDAQGPCRSMTSWLRSWPPARRGGSAAPGQPVCLAGEPLFSRQCRCALALAVGAVAQAK